LTQKPDVRHELGGNPFSPDGRQIVYSANEREVQDMDLFVRNLETAEARVLLGGDANYFAGEWSPDGRHVLVMRWNSNMDQDLFLVKVESGESRLLTPHEGETKFYPGPWHPEGHGFYLVSDQEREFLGLAFYELEAEMLRWVETPAWDVQEVEISADGHYLAWLVNEDGYSRLYIRNLETENVSELPALPDGVLSQLRFSPTDSLLAFYLTRPERPATVYLLDVETGQHWELTQSFLGGIPAEEMIRPRLIRYPTHDGRKIPAFLYKPQGLESSEAAPLVLSIHGGPESQEQPGYNHNGLYQYLLSRGIGILAPNIRGSTGYGKSYQSLIHRDWGGAELKDLEFAARYARELDWVDGRRLGVFGGSFGGFATLSCVTRLPEYWAAAVDIVGPSNLVTLTKAVPPFWRRFMKKWVGDPDEDYELLVERSPITYVDNVRAPLLVIQGANDPRVVKKESDQMVERLEQLGREVSYIVFEDEGHDFSKTSNALQALRAAAEWFERHLLDGA
jgi:dipeptidyl aminopeptidase/acylaminoacyl peptidase